MNLEFIKGMPYSIKFTQRRKKRARTLKCQINMSIESQAGNKIDAQIFTDPVRSQGHAQNRYRRINKFYQLLLCVQKDIFCLKMKSWISFRLLTQLHKLRSQLRGSFLTWNFVLSGFISNCRWESHSTTRWRSWEMLANARSVSRVKGKKQLSIVHERFIFAIWDDIRQVIEVKGEQ